MESNFSSPAGYRPAALRPEQVAQLQEWERQLRAQTQQQDLVLVAYDPAGHHAVPQPEA
ncbi:MAG: hypothetical protein K6T26_01240 [Alicyclobacillus sp.]|nr:hypothetical protein [Alicyclobacillus sp.]